MKAFGRFRAWLAGPRSDFPLLVVVLILANLVGARAFFRIDLTAQNSYSLSAASKRAVRTIEQPLSVKVFFSDSLPAPYNGVRRYLSDLLVEYKGASRGDFSYEFFDMEKPENKDLAESFGVYPLQLQEVKNDEVGFKNAYMGLAVSYGDGVEALDGLTSTDGLEYRLTTRIGKMIATVDALSGLDGKVDLTLYASGSLARLGIAGFGDLEAAADEAYRELNKKSQDRISFRRVDPDSEEAAALADRYGLQKLTWTDKSGAKTTGVMGLVLERGEAFRTLPFELVRNLFGGYGVAGVDDIKQDLSAALESLVSKSPAVAYVTGHGELDLADAERGAGLLRGLAEDSYDLQELNLAEKDFPRGVDVAVVCGPKTAFSEAELYKVDQFLMRGGKLFLLLDPFDEIMPQGEMAYFGGQPSYPPIDAGLGRLLSKYGLEMGSNYVLDEACFVSRQQGQGTTSVYYAPLVDKAGLDQKHPVSRNLSRVLFLQAAGLEVAEGAAGPERTYTVLAKSSPSSWLMEKQISLAPYAMVPPAKDKMAARNLVVMAEGRFESAFDAAPADPAGGQLPGAAGDASGLELGKHLAKSVQPGKVILAGTSRIVSPALIDQGGRQPVAVLARNALDWLGGNEDLIEMRTKGLSLNTLRPTTAAVRNAAKAVNQYGLPVLVAVAGLAAWRIRGSRRRKIQAAYAAAAGAAKEEA